MGGGHAQISIYNLGRIIADQNKYNLVLKRLSEIEESHYGNTRRYVPISRQGIENHEVKYI